MSANKPLGPTDLKRLNRSWRKRTDNHVAMMLCSLSNPFNVGSIIRSASVFGLDTLYLVGATPGPSDASVQKMAMGTDREMEIVRIDDPKAAISQVRNEDWVPIAVELTAEAQPSFEVAFDDNVCLVMGNEANGLPASITGDCESTIYIPQPGKTASLNVAVSAAVALYELRRHEWSAQ